MGQPLGVFGQDGCFVGGEIALEPAGSAVAFHHQQVRADAVEEEAVVADDHGAAGEVDQRLLQHPHRGHVEVVGRLVQQQQVAAAAEHFGQVDAVPLAARTFAHLLLLLRTAEIEPRHVRPGVDRDVAQLDPVRAVGDFLEDASCSSSSASRC